MVDPDPRIQWWIRTALASTLNVVLLYLGRPQRRVLSCSREFPASRLIPALFEASASVRVECRRETELGERQKHAYLTEDTCAEVDTLKGLNAVLSMGCPGVVPGRKLECQNES